jgi:Cu/Zn superoxide dismutase
MVRAVVVVGLSLLLVGCGSSGTTATSKSPATGPTPTQSPRTLTFKLYGQSGDPARGTVRVDLQRYGYTLTLTVEGLTPKSRHSFMIHAGSCAHLEDMYYVPVAVATADAKGRLTAVGTKLGIYSVPAAGRTMCMHGDSDSIYGPTDVACGDMTM